MSYENFIKNYQPSLQTGYYWIKFPGRHYWEPGGYDQTTHTFMLIGSTEPWFPFQLHIGERIRTPE